MARGAATTVDNNFTRGLVTEFTAMNFPENAVTEGDNCVYSELGFVRRREGMNFEDNYVRHTIPTLTAFPNCYLEYKWHSVNNIGTISFVVQQMGESLRFFKINTLTGLSSGLQSFAVNMFLKASPGSSITQVSSTPCQFTTGRGYLIVAHPYCEPFYVSYDVLTNAITTTNIEISIRDFERLDDGLEIDERPTTLTDAHKYNLYNQGWDTQTRTFIDRFTTPPIQQALAYWDSQRADFPSNADIFWSFRSADGDFNYGNIDRTYVGNSPAPSGHYIYNALSINRTAKSGIPGLPSVLAGSARPSCVVFYAGRAFYAGVAANRFSDKIYFTQIIDTDDKFGKGFQQNDPTSESPSDLLDSDGGVISLPLIESIITMRVIGDQLIILATNGLYLVGGTQQGPFKATDYTVTYLSSIGGVSHLSVLEVDGGLMWWNSDGIYAVAKDNVGNFQVNNVSKSTIQSLLNTIPAANRPYVKGAYNKKDQIIQWLFSDSASLTGFQYNRILELNLLSKAFYPYTIDTSLRPRVVGLVSVGGQSTTSVTQDVEITSGGILEDVLTTLADVVQIETEIVAPNSELFKYATTQASAGSNTFTYSEIHDDNLVDWRSYNGVGVSYFSYGHSGYRVRGEFLRPFNSTPILFVIQNLEAGRCLVSGLWDYNFRQSNPQELYITRPEVDYILRRVKLRGKGRSLQIRFESVGNAQFSLVGWSTFDTGGTLP